MVNQLRFSRTLADFGQVFLTDQPVDQRRLSNIGTADKRKLRPNRRWTFLGTGAAFDERGLPRTA
jgi:hypothetical protein